MTSGADERAYPWCMERITVTLRHMDMTGISKSRLLMTAALLGSLAACSSESLSSSGEPTAPPSGASSSGENVAVKSKPKDATASDVEPEHDEVTVRAKVVILRPNGVGPLRLGMSRSEVNSTDFASARLGSRHDGWRGCAIVEFSSKVKQNPYLGDIDGTVSPTQGLESIVATRRMVTPNGTGLGSTVDEVRRAYPEENARRGYLLTIPASTGAVYRIQMGVNGRVESLALELMRRDCVR